MDIAIFQEWSRTQTIIWTRQMVYFRTFLRVCTPQEISHRPSYLARPNIYLLCKATLRESKIIFIKRKSFIYSLIWFFFYTFLAPLGIWSRTPGCDTLMGQCGPLFLRAKHHTAHTYIFKFPIPSVETLNDLFWNQLNHIVPFLR